MNIGAVTALMSPRAGGIYEVVGQLSRELNQHSCDVTVFAGRDSGSEESIRRFGDLPTKLGSLFGPKSFSYQRGLVQELIRAKLELVHLHGLWSYPSIATRLWAEGRKPYVISPHGMLDSWALKNSSLKKVIASSLYEAGNIRGAACIHALCDEEKESIRSFGFDGPIAVIANGVNLADANTWSPEPAWREFVPQNSKVLLFFGRIHPKKGLGSLLEGFSLVDRTGRSDRWHLVIAGWGESTYQNSLQTVAKELGISDHVHFVGPQFGENRRASLAFADAFILPSLSEGLPMTVLEAWSYGLPVLMTKACNLEIGFSRNAALRIDADPLAIAAGLNQLHLLSQDARIDIGTNGRCLVESHYSWSRIADKMYMLYKWILGRGEMPSFIDVDCHAA